MQNRKQILGTSGEEIAVDYLISQGYVVFDRNWRSKTGEIDIVASEPIDTRDELIFVEVKLDRAVILAIQLKQSPLLST